MPRRTAAGEIPGSLRLRVEPVGEEVVSRPEIAVIAGYTGRDREGVLEHIRELEALGVVPPPEVPMFYSVVPSLLVQGATLVTTERGTSGEAEVGLVVDGGKVYVTIASDHTDRALERFDVAAAKRACHKVIGSAAWRLEDVAGHWDSLSLRSWIGDEAEDLYQDGLLAALEPPSKLLESIPWSERPESFMLLCGTVATIGGLRESLRFRAELRDPVLDRCLELDYWTRVLDFVRTTPDEEARIERAAEDLSIEMGPERVSRLALRLQEVERRLQ